MQVCQTAGKGDERRAERVPLGAGPTVDRRWTECFSSIRPRLLFSDGFG
jgi:hypothetical protein